MGITNTSRKWALLLHYAGEKVTDMFETEVILEIRPRMDYQPHVLGESVKALENCFEIQKYDDHLV